MSKEICVCDINTGDAPERHKDGSVNVVLALWTPEMFTESNSYLPAWNVVNSVYYNINQHMYRGWIALEDVNY